jgi:transposase
MRFWRRTGCFGRLTREGAVAACYEAGVSGYDLYRQITTCGVACQVIAPALTPRRPGQRIKTDRRDAAKLVRLYRAGELTAIHVPDEAEEAVRDLTRCREDVRRDVLRWRQRLLKFLDRHGRLYVTGRNWSQRHWTWIRAQRFDLAPLQRTFEATLFALEQALAHQAELDKEIEALAAQAPYAEPVGWLRCFRGIDTLSAMILLAEIVDFQRFPHARELMAYLGLVPRGAMSFLGGVAAGTMGARLESPRRTYATPGPRTGTTRAPRRRPLPTNHGHAALPRATRVYQLDSSSKPPHRDRRRRPQESLHPGREPDP